MKASVFYHGAEKYNCAQAVLRAFMEGFYIPQETIDHYKKAGGGRAEDGICGALYAVREILKNNDKFKAAEKIFTDSAGSAKCKEIRSLKLLDCPGCVDLAADILNQLDRK